MLGIQHFSVFLGTVVLVLITPGPDTLYILGRTLSQGKRGGIFSVIGSNCGCLTHTVAAAVGLSALIYTSAIAFTVLKLVGACYLLYLGARLMLARARTLNVAALPSESARRILMQGYLTNVLNPKVALFFLSFLPQFVDPAAPSRLAAFLALGGFFTMGAVFWSLFLVLGSAPLLQALRKFPRLEAAVDKATGSLFITLGLRLAVAPR